MDCDPNKVALNGYSLHTLYANLDKIATEKKLKHVTVVLDACFSGASVKGTLLATISPIYITVEKESQLVRCTEFHRQMRALIPSLKEN